MSTTKTQQLGVVFMAFLVGLVACTDRRPDNPDPVQRQVMAFQPKFDEVGQVVDEATGYVEAMQMKVKSGSLYLTGRPFGFTRWDVSADPAVPRKAFNANETMFSSFSNPEVLGPWVLDRVGSGALEIVGQFAFMSGIAATSTVDMRETNYPVEIERMPVQVGENPTSDEARVYKAMVKHPALPIIYGFREQDFLYILNSSSVDLPIRGRLPYIKDQTVCCVQSAAYFKGRIYVAMGSRLWILSLDGNGNVTAVNEKSDIQAMNVVATNDYLFVQHEPTISHMGSVSRGIYIFDGNGEPVNYVTISPIKFAVHDDSTHIYTNEDNTKVKIYRLNWQYADLGVSSSSYYGGGYGAAPFGGSISRSAYSRRSGLTRRW